MRGADCLRCDIQIGLGAFDQNRRMRVLHVITALGVGGAERMLLKLLGAPALSGVEQRVVAMLPGGVLAAPMRATGARVDMLNFLGGIPVVVGVSQLARIARSWRPDVLHGWMYHGNLGASCAHIALGRQAPLLWSIRQSLPSLQGENAFARAAIYLGRSGSSRPDRLLFNSHTSLRQHQDFGFDVQRAQYLPNGFDTTTFAPDAAARAHWRSAWGAGADDVVFGLMARHHPIKDHGGFLQAARLLHAARPDVRFVLAGTGVDESNARLAQLLAAAGLGARVHLLGERSDVAAVMAGLDVAVSSSRAEAFSNAIGEAMSCALPCVATDVGDSAHLLGRCGRVVPPGAPEAMAAAMQEMVDLGGHARAALGAEARVRVQAEFSLDAVAGRQLALYACLCAERVAAPQQRA